jgi:hypothetical protein
MFTQPAVLKDKSTFEISFTQPPAQNADPTLTVEQSPHVTGNTLYAAPEGQSQAKGTADSPLDFATAIKLVPPGGQIVLAAGDYPQTAIPLAPAA